VPECQKLKILTSTPGIPTGVYLYMPITPWLHSQRWLTDAASSPANLSHLARDCPMRYQHFSYFWPWGANLWAKVHQNRSWPATHPGLPSCQISSPCVNPRRRYPLQSICRQTEGQTKKQ